MYILNEYYALNVHNMHKIIVQFIVNNCIESDIIVRINCH